MAFKSSDGTIISIDAKATGTFNKHSIFKDLDAASDFFKGGSIGYSPNGNKYEGLLLHAENWEVKALEVSKVTSSFFEDESIFPKGSVVFDNALLMINIRHDWYSKPDKTVITH